MIDIDNILDAEYWRQTLTASKAMYSLPDLAEDEIWSCMQCGEDVRKPKFYKHIYQTSWCRETGNKTENFDQFYVSQCCLGDLEIYNTVLDKPRSIPEHHFDCKDIALKDADEAKFYAQAITAERWVP